MWRITVGIMVFVKAKCGPPNFGDSERMFTVQYFDDNGNMVIRSGGSRAWRCNNPGNLHASSYSRGKARHSIGSAGDGRDTYAVYPDYATGHEALVIMLRGSVYVPLTLREAMKRYDQQNPNYINIIVSKTGLQSERKIKSLNDIEFKEFWRAIEETEKWTIGREDPIPKEYITGVHMKHGSIYEYQIQMNGKNVWISKQNAITLAQEWKLHATVIHHSNGKMYLRPEFHGKAFRKMVC